MFDVQKLYPFQHQFIMQHFVFHVVLILIMKDKWPMNNEVLQRKLIFNTKAKKERKFDLFDFSSDMDEALLDENVVVTLDDVQTIKMDFNPVIENTMWFA